MGKLNRSKLRNKLLFLILFNTKIIFSQYVQYVPFTHGFTFEEGYTERFYTEIGYGFVFSKFYLKNREYEIKSKEILIAFDEKIGYNFIGAMTFKSSARLTFEAFNWNDKLFNYSFGADYTYITNFQNSNNIVTPKIGIIIFFGTIELNYGYNFILDKSKKFQMNGNNIGLVFRPYIFMKSMKKKWS
jgi:hypothetical protein